MKKRIWFVFVSMSLLFIFTAAMVMTIHSTADAKQKPEFSCCAYKDCGPNTPPKWSYGIWQYGKCTCRPYPYVNPNGCRIDCAFCD